MIIHNDLCLFLLKLIAEHRVWSAKIVYDGQSAYKNFKWSLAFIYEWVSKERVLLKIIYIMYSFDKSLKSLWEKRILLINQTKK